MRNPGLNMKTFLGGILSLLVVIVLDCAEAGGTNQPAGTRLTVELRDGSRVVGTSKEKNFDFHSGLLGNLRLPWQKIRLVEPAANTNLVKLTTADGDALAVKFVTKEIRVVTAKGEVRVAVGLIKRLRVSDGGLMGRPREGLVGLWSGEGNGVDSVRGNNGVLRNVSFTDGVAGKAFTFAPDNFPPGSYTGVQIADRPEFVLTRSLTIEAWIRPRGDGSVIFFRGDHRPGLDPYSLSTGGNHSVHFGICGGGGEGESATVETTVAYCVWTHVAAVLDGDGGRMILYTNGVLAAQAETRVRPMGGLIPDQTPGVGIGNVNDGGNNFPFVGDLDEVGLYNRALSEEEVSAIYEENAARAGGRAEPLPPRNAAPRLFFTNPMAGNFSD